MEAELKVGDLVLSNPIQNLGSVLVWPGQGRRLEISAGTPGVVIRINKDNKNLEVCTMGHICQTIVDRWILAEDQKEIR
jgi:hypothetical protein